MGISKHRLLLLIAMFFTLITFSGCSDSDDDDDDKIVKESPDQNIENGDKPMTRFIEGLIVDGYISGADVKFCNKTVSTNNKGKFKVPFIKTCKESIIANGGIDKATGEAFEGVIKAPAPKDDKSSIVATPLTTLVASLVENGQDEKEASKLIAKSLGISEELLKQDPIETLKSGSEQDKLNAANAIKQALVVQKLAEISSKAVPQSERNLAFSSIMGAVAKHMSEGGSFDDVVNDTDSIMEEAAKSINGSTDILKKSAAAAKQVVKLVSSIDINSLLKGDVDDAISAKYKTLEIVTSKLEKSVTPNGIDDKQLEKVAKTIVMLGGLNGIEKTVSKGSATTKASELDFLNQDLIEKQAETYTKIADTLKDGGISDKDIVSIMENLGKDLNNKTDDSKTKLDDLVKNAIKKTVSNTNKIDIDSIVDNVIKSEDSKKEAIADLNSSVQNKAPTFTGIIKDIELTVDIAMTPINFAIHFKDLENDNLTYKVSCSLPKGLSFNNSTLSGTPTEDGTTTCKIIASDSKKEVSSNSFKIIVNKKIVEVDTNKTVVTDTNKTVAVTNKPPVLNGLIPDISGNLNDTINKDLSSYFKDDNDTLTYKMTCSNDLGLTLSTAGVLSGSLTETGTSICSITATDTKNQSVKSSNFTIICANATSSTSSSTSSSGGTTDLDKLSLSDNLFTMGSDKYERNTTVSSGGTFSQVRQKPLSADVIAKGDFTSIYDVSFGITNPSTDGMEKETKNVGLIIRIKNSKTKQILVSVIDKVELSKDSSGKFSTSVPANAKLYGFAKRGNGTFIKTEKTNLSKNGIISTDSNGKISYNLSNVIKKFETNDQVGKSIKELKQYFGKEGTYSIVLGITGLDGVTNSANVYSKVLDGFTDDIKTSLESKLNETKTFGFSGNLIISNSENVAPTVTLSDNATIKVGDTTNLKVTITDDSDTNLVITKVESNATSIATVTKTDSNISITGVKQGDANITVTVKDSDGATTTKSIIVKVVEAPKFSGTIADINTTKDVSFSKSFTSYFTNASEFNLTSCELPSGLTFSKDGNLTGKPTEEKNVTGCKITAKNSFGDSVNSNTFGINVIVVNINYNIVTDHDLAKDYNEKGKVSVALSGTLSSKILSIGTSKSSISDENIKDTSNIIELYLVEKAKDTDNYLDLKFKTDEYSDGDKIYIKLGDKTLTINVGSVKNEDELLLQ